MCTSSSQCISLVLISCQELRQELHHLQVNYSQLKQQHSALKARNKTLTADCKELRGQIASLSTALKQKEETMEGRGEDRRINNRLQGEVERLRKENNSLSTQLSRSASEIIFLQEALQEPHVQLSSRSHQCVPHPPLLIPPSSPATSLCSMQSGPQSVTVSKERESLPPLPLGSTRQPVGRRERGIPAPHSINLMRQTMSAGHVPVR